MTQIKILILEDDIALCNVVKEYLTIKNYHVDICTTAECFNRFLKCCNYDLILLDLNLPDSDGLNVLAKLREHYDMLVYVISGRTDQESRIYAFNLGADDFILKPFSIREIELKIKNALSRNHRSNSTTTNQLSNDWDFSLDDDLRCIIKKGYEPLSVTRGEFELIKQLTLANGKTVSREALISHLSECCNINSEESITTLVYRLRKKFEMLDLECPIVTCMKEGYRIQKQDK